MPISLTDQLYKKPTSLTDQVYGGAKPEVSEFDRSTLPKTPYDSLMAEASEKHGVPYEVLYRTLKRESGFNPKAVPVDPKTGKAISTAKGIAQFIDSTAKEVGVKDPFDPKQAIPGAADYLKRLYDKFGDWKLAVAAYNQGPGEVSRVGGIPPKASQYVKDIFPGDVVEPKFDPKESQVTTPPQKISLTDQLYKPKVAATPTPAPTPTPKPEASAAERFYGQKGINPVLPIPVGPQAAYMGMRGFGPPPEGGFDELGRPMRKDGSYYYTEGVNDKEARPKPVDKQMTISQDLSKPNFIVRALKDIGEMFGVDVQPKLSEAAKAQAVVRLMAQEEGVPLSEYRKSPELIEKAASGFVNSVTFGMIPAIRKSMTGEEDFEATSTPGYIGHALGSLGGLAMGPFKVGEAMIGPIRYLPRASQGEKVATRVLKEALHDSAVIGMGMGVAATGEALEKTTFSQAAGTIYQAAKSGALTGTIFGASRGLFPKEGVETATRLITGLVGLNALRAMEVGGNPFTDRPVGDVIFDTALDAYFLYRGLPKSFEEYAREVTNIQADKEKIVKTREVMDQLPDDANKRILEKQLAVEQERLKNKSDKFLEKFNGDLAIAEEVARQSEDLAKERMRPVVESRPEMAEDYVPKSVKMTKAEAAKEARKGPETVEAWQYKVDSYPELKDKVKVDALGEADTTTPPGYVQITITSEGRNGTFNVKASANEIIKKFNQVEKEWKVEPKVEEAKRPARRKIVEEPKVEEPVGEPTLFKPAVQAADGTIATSRYHFEAYNELKNQGADLSNMTDGWIVDGKFYNRKEFNKLTGGLDQEALKEGKIISDKFQLDKEGVRVPEVIKKSVAEPVVGDLSGIRELPKNQGFEVLDPDTGDAVARFETRDEAVKFYDQVFKEEKMTAEELSSLDRMIGESDPSTAFEQSKEKMERLAKAFAEKGEHILEDPEEYLQKLINDANLWKSGKDIPIDTVRNAMSELASRSGELRGSFFSGVDHLAFTEMASEAARWARNLKRPGEGGGTRLNVMIPVDRIPESVKFWYKYAKGITGKIRASEVYRDEGLLKGTGFWLARDGKWRFELDDSKAKYKPSNEVISDYNKTGKSPAYLTDVLDYPELYKAVPRLKDTLVVYDKGFDKNGEYNINTNTITLKAPHFKSTLFHEIGHGINRSVGAFSGGSPGGVLVERTRKIIKDLKDVAKTKEVTDEIVSVEKDFNSGKIGVNEAGEKLIDIVERRAPSSADKFVKTLNNVLNQNSAFEAYRRIPGEMESRVTEARLNMSKEARMSEPPWVTLDKMLDEEGIGYGSGLKLYSGIPVDLMIKKSKEFAKWFGNSVVKEVVYHGTPKRFAEFDKEKRYGGIGIHFGTREQAVNRLKETVKTAIDMKDSIKSTLHEGYLKLENPVDFPVDAGIWNVESVKNMILSNELEYKFPKTIRRIVQLAEDYDTGKIHEYAATKKLEELFKEEGYDGFTYPNKVEGSGTSYAVFESSQFKSTKNIGTYDPNTGNVFYSGIPVDEAVKLAKKALANIKTPKRLELFVRDKFPDLLPDNVKVTWLNEMQIPSEWPAKANAKFDWLDNTVYIASNTKARSKRGLPPLTESEVAESLVHELQHLKESNDIKTWDEMAKKKETDLGDNFTYSEWKGHPSEQGPIEKGRLARGMFEDVLTKEYQTGTKLYSGIPLDEAAKMIVAGARKVSEYTREARGLKKFRPKSATDSLRAELNRSFVDRSGNIRRELLDQLGEDGYNVVQAMYLAKGSSALSANMLKQMRKEVYEGYNKRMRTVFDTVALAHRMVSIGKYKSEGEFNFPKGIKLNDFIAYLELFPQIEKLSPKEAYDLYHENPDGSIGGRVGAYFDWMKKPLKDMLDSGLISQDEYDKLIKHDYRRIKLVDVFDRRYRAEVGGKKRTVYDSGVEALARGRETDIYEPSSEIMALEVFNRSYGRILNNEANKALLDVATKMPDNEFVRVKTKDGESIPSGWNRIFVFDKGERKSLYLSPEMSKEWITSSPEMSYRLGQFLRYASGSPVLRTFATGINWGFALANMPRDVMHAWFTARAFENGKWKPIYNPNAPIFMAQMGKDYANVFSDALLRKGRYQDYIEEGGGMEFLVHQGRLFQRGRHLESGVDKVFDFLGYFGETSEVMTRLAIRERVIEKRARELGISKEEAMKDKKITREATFVARDYMDFGQGGGIAKALDNAFPYLNASIQGTRGLFRSFKPESGSALSSTYKLSQFAALVAGLTIANWSRSPNAMKNLQGNIADQNNLTIPLGDDFSYVDEKGETVYPFIKIPLDPGQRFFKVFFEAATNKWLGKEVDPIAVAKRLADLSPVGVSQLPPTISGVLGYMTNKDFWLNEDIWNQTDKPFSYPESRKEFTEKTPQFYRDIGGLTGLSPERTRYAVEQLVTSGSEWSYLAGAGYDALFSDIPKSNKEEHLAHVLSKVPGVKRFIGVTNPYSKHATKIESERERASISRFEQNRNVDTVVNGYLYKDNATREDVFDEIGKQAGDDRDAYNRLIDRFKFEEAIQELPEKSFWRRMKGLPVEAKAAVFVDRLKKATPEEEEKLWDEYAIVSKAKGVLGNEFRQEVMKLMSE